MTDKAVGGPALDFTFHIALTPEQLREMQQTARGQAEAVATEATSDPRPPLLTRGPVERWVVESFGNEWATVCRILEAERYRPQDR